MTGTTTLKSIYEEQSLRLVTHEPDRASSVNIKQWLFVINFSGSSYQDWYKEKSHCASNRSVKLINHKDFTIKWIG